MQLCAMTHSAVIPVPLLDMIPVPLLDMVPVPLLDMIPSAPA